MSCRDRVVLRVGMGALRNSRSFRKRGASPAKAGASQEIRSFWPRPELFGGVSLVGGLLERFGIVGAYEGSLDAFGETSCSSGWDDHFGVFAAAAPSLDAFLDEWLKAAERVVVTFWALELHQLRLDYFWRWDLYYVRDLAVFEEEYSIHACYLLCYNDDYGTHYTMKGFDE